MRRLFTQGTSTGCHDQGTVARRWLALLLWTLSFCSAAQADPLRLSRPSYKPAVFHSLPPHYTEHWWRQLREPTCCGMVLCHGECAYKGNAKHSACSIVPMYPILKGSPSGCGN